MNRDRWTELEIERATLCRQTSPEMTVAELASYYNIERAVVTQLFGEVEETSSRRKRDQRTTALTWAEQNVGVEIGAQQLATIANCSLPTAHRIMESRADVFRKIRRGTWEIRDPHADRKAEKQGDN
jgi:hypothetical protein